MRKPVKYVRFCEAAADARSIAWQHHAAHQALWACPGTTLQIAFYSICEHQNGAVK
jgi:hypothetical protein